MIKLKMTGIEIFDNELAEFCLTSTSLLLFKAVQSVLTTLNDKQHKTSERKNLCWCSSEGDSRKPFITSLVTFICHCLSREIT